ncbi:hypothetical protein ORI20_16905 [Mycobacterium sp. CVI_P3]|uniref:Uncharacterized protein n=1 Tax=Mycobacterium pinniadriaticum TaxID=2994102 RepID=A0ABT3SFU8_9MYCO|nr:hypothetical protein [Mycobacterium pinniadriaticum]MCX2931965.1 hypothetical protein [Mycobacterium pinniadriaticum]MCX2938389.1 hypothetical protein [Mycobacterium pinniadriaticum]
MFGFGRNLRSVGLHAYAEVLSAEQTALAVSADNPNLMNNTEIRWELQVRVSPDDGLPFDATVHALLPRTCAPRPGSRVAVRYDPRPVSTADAAIEGITNADPSLMGNRRPGRVSGTDDDPPRATTAASRRGTGFARSGRPAGAAGRAQGPRAHHRRGVEQQKRRILGEP